MRRLRRRKPYSFKVLEYGSRRKRPHLHFVHNMPWAESNPIRTKTVKSDGSISMRGMPYNRWLASLSPDAAALYELLQSCGLGMYHCEVVKKGVGGIINYISTYFDKSAPLQEYLPNQRRAVTYAFSRNWPGGGAWHSYQYVASDGKPHPADPGSSSTIVPCEASVPATLTMDERHYRVRQNFKSVDAQLRPYSNWVHQWALAYTGTGYPEYMDRYEFKSYLHELYNQLVVRVGPISVRSVVSWSRAVRNGKVVGGFPVGTPEDRAYPRRATKIDWINTPVLGSVALNSDKPSPTTSDALKGLHNGSVAVSDAFDDDNPLALAYPVLS